jgi:hypothetical protein
MWLELTATGEATDQSLALLVAWTIWKQRNSRIFSQGEENESSVFAEIHDQVVSWSMSNIRPLSTLVVNSVSE